MPVLYVYLRAPITALFKKLRMRPHESGLRCMIKISREGRSCCVRFDALIFPDLRDGLAMTSPAALQNPNRPLL